MVGICHFVKIEVHQIVKSEPSCALAFFEAHTIKCDAHQLAAMFNYAVFEKFGHVIEKGMIWCASLVLNYPPLKTDVFFRRKVF